MIKKDHIFRIGDSRFLTYPRFMSLRRRALARHPSGFLLLAQVVSLVLYAAFEKVPSGHILLGAFGILVLVLVVWAVTRSPAISWIAWILAAMTVVLSVLAWLAAVPSLSVWAPLLEAALYWYGAGGLIAYMMGDEKVTIDELFAAGATFTLIAWAFAYLYVVCEAWFPGSFSGGTPPGRSRPFIELLFLSFTNLSATGLSDITPVTPPARVIAMLEQFAGIGYVAVVVSRLVSMTIVRHSRRG